jgi:hypothetical protein
MLRASKKNGLATRNFIVAGMGVQVGVTQALIYLKLATPFNLGWVIFTYCTTFLLLNLRAIHEVQSKYYLFKQREWHFFETLRKFYSYHHETAETKSGTNGVILLS